MRSTNQVRAQELNFEAAVSEEINRRAAISQKERCEKIGDIIGYSVFTGLIVGGVFGIRASALQTDEFSDTIECIFSTLAILFGGARIKVMCDNLNKKFERQVSNDAEQRESNDTEIYNPIAITGQSDNNASEYGDIIHV